jgi:TDG/mug DNA glycosylase family protein
MPSDHGTQSEESWPCGAGLPPARGQSTEVIILGSFPGRLSLLHHEYYGNPQNHFWKIVEALFQIDHHLPYSVRINRLTDQRIALWDVISACSREGSADARILDPAFNNLDGFFRSCPSLRLLVLNGSSAGRYFNSQKIPIRVPVVVLPSTSPANTRVTLSEKVKRWEIIRTQRV